MDQVEQQPEKRDVSRQTLVVLVVLAIIVSLLGTFTVLRETSASRIVYENTGSSSAQGTVSLTIVDPSNPAIVQSDIATGRVTMVLVPGE